MADVFFRPQRISSCKLATA